MAAKRPTHVPKFGNWDANDHMPFTAVFDHARAGKGGKPVNPNDPAENPGAFGRGQFNPNDPSENPAAFGRGRPFNPNDPSDNPEAFGIRNPPAPGPVAPRGRHERKPSVEESDLRRPVEAPGRNNPYDGRNPVPDPIRRAGSEPVASRPQADLRQPPRPGSAGAIGGVGPGRTGSGGVGSDRSNGDSGHGSAHGSAHGSSHGNQSPVHPQAYQQRFGRPSPNSPARTAGDPAFAPPTPSRLRPGGRANDTPDRSVPKFGDWGKADGFTVIFESARQDKITGGVPGRPNFPADSPARRGEEDLYKTPGREKKPEPKWYHSFCPCCAAPKE